MQYFLKVRMEPEAGQIGSENSSEPKENLGAVLSEAIYSAGGKFFLQGATGPMYRMSVWPPDAEFIVALGSAGVFTALIQTINKFLERNKGREITVEREGKKITIKAHGLREEREILQELFPELVAPKVRQVPKKRD
jgi:Effector Associated Constant Component 1